MREEYLMRLYLARDTHTYKDTRCAKEVYILQRMCWIFIAQAQLWCYEKKHKWIKTTTSISWQITELLGCLCISNSSDMKL